MALLGLMVTSTLVVIAAAVLFFILRNDQETWRSRQKEAARHAATTVAAFVRDTKESLVLAGLVERNGEAVDNQVMQDLLDHSPALLELVRLDKEGVITSAAYQDAPLLANLFTLPQSSWFAESRSGNDYLGNVEISAQSVPYLIVAVPAPDGGVVAARLQMTMLWDLMAALRFGETGETYVVNGDGVIVAHTNPEDALSHTHVPGSPDLLSETGDHYSALSAFFRQNEMVGVGAPIAGTEWIIVSEVSLREVFSTTRTALVLFGFGALFFALLMMLITGRYLTHLIVDPIEQLQAGAVRIGKGDLDHRILTRRYDEIGEVALAFNEMAHGLRVRESELRSQSVRLADQVEERRHAEQALEKAKAELEIRVMQRTQELRLSNALVSEREELLRAFASALPDPAFILDSEGNYLEVLTAKVGLDDTETDEARGRNVDQFLSIGGTEQLMLTIDRTIESREPQSLQYEIATANGSRWFEGRSAPMHSGNGDAPMVVWLARDITESKLDQQRISDSLREKEVMLKEIHHRVKNNLQVISSLLYLQSKDIENEETQGLFQDSQIASSIHGLGT